MPKTEHQRRDTDGRTPPGMTQEQLEFFAGETQRAAKKGAREGSRRMRNSAVAGFLILLLGIGYVFRDSSDANNASRDAIVTSGKTVAVDGCNRDFARDVKFRNLLLRLRQASAANETADPEAKKQALEFYDQQLDRFQLPDCREAEAALTADPEDLKKPPRPFYPGADYAPKTDPKLQP